MESIEQYQQDDTQEYLIKLYQSQEIPSTVLALASPGTGKTTTISRIIKELAGRQSSEARPNFLVLTFTRKTRYDLISKLKKLPGKYETKEYVRSRVKNFHSFAYDLVEWKSIIDKNTETQRLNAFLRKQKLNDRDENSLRKEINRVKDSLMSRGCTEEQWNEVLEPMENHHSWHYIATYLREYKDWLKKQFAENWAITYDYSLIKAIEEINGGGKPRKGTVDVDSLELLIVDEFQDSNPAQLKIVEALLKRSKKEVKLLMVGDFDQNIYSWRGVSIQEIDQFIRSRNPKVVNLANSYRLGESLKALSQKLITSFLPYEFFRRRFYNNYQLHAKGKHNQQPEVRVFEQETSEVRWTVDKIYEHMKEGTALGDMTVLVRSTKTAFVRMLIEEIKQRKARGYPEILYEVKFYNDVLNSATVKYLFAIFSYFKKVEKDDCGEEIKRITHPIAFVGEADEARNAMIKNHKISRELVVYERKQNYFEKRQMSWNRFLDDWERIREIVINCPKNGFLHACKQIYQIVREAPWGDAELQEEKIVEFYEVVEEILQSMDEEILENEPLFSVFHELSLLAERREKGSEEHDSNDMLVRKRRDRLQIQTIHTSKGLEFQVVIVGSLNYEFPYFSTANRFSTEFASSKIDLKEWEKIENQKEELRVIYTAITRSARYCYVNSSKNFDRPAWLKKSDVREHPQFKFLRENAKFCGVVLYKTTEEREMDDDELDKEAQRLERLIENVNIE